MEMFFLMLVVVGGGLAIYIVPKMLLKRIAERARAKRVKPYLTRSHIVQTPQKRRSPSLDLNIPTYQRKGVLVQLTEVSELQAQSVGMAAVNIPLSEVAEVKAQLAELQAQLAELKKSRKKRSSKGDQSPAAKVVNQEVEFVTEHVSEQEPLFEVIS